MKQDKAGFIWMNTDKGLVKYNGIKFKTYTIENGLPNNDNFSFLMDSKENKWLYSFSNIARMDKYDKVSVFDKTGSYFSFFMSDNYDNLYYLQRDLVKFPNTDKYRFYSIENDSSFYEEIVYSNSPDVSRIYFYRWRNNIYYLLYKIESGNIVKSGKWDHSLHKFLDNNDLNCPKITMADMFLKALELVEIDSLYSLLIGTKKYALIKGNKKVFENNFPNNSYKFTFGDWYKMDGKFFMLLQNGIYEYTIDVNGNDKWIPFFSRQKVTGILKDREGNIWISTLGEGLFKFFGYGTGSGLNQVQFMSLENTQKVTGDKNDRIWYSNILNQIKSGDSKLLYDPKLLKDLRFMERYSNSFYYGGSNAFFDGKDLCHEYGYKYMAITSDTLCLTSSFGLSFIDLKKLQKAKNNAIQYDIDVNGRMYAVFYENGVFYSGNQEGLFWGRPDKDELIPICLDPELEAVSVNGIKKSSDGLLWVSTDGNGVYVVRDKEPVKHIEKELLDGNINSLKIDEKDQVWISTKYGVNKIVRTKDNVYEIKKYTSFHGLPSDYVNDTYCYNDTLYVATDAGLVRMDMKMIDQMDFDQPPPIYINNVVMTAGNSAVSLKTDSTYTLNHDQNSISVTYAGISYRSNGNIRYHYRLLPLNDNWRLTENDRVDISDLGAGTYTFEVKAINALGSVSLKPATYSFVIKPHFTRTWWFITLSGVLFTGFIFLGIFSYFNYIRRRNQEKALIEKQLSQLKLQALQSQLNPHFIFNSLNAVQQLINEEDTEQANIYLARFAKLMRLYLEGADNQFITLRQELEVLKYYVQLEHLRFKDKFSYTIIIDENINLDNYQVPAMLMQPHVENAIRHGIARDIRTDRILSVSVQKHSSGVVVSVTDNGIGRKKSLELKQMKDAEHRSMGNKISKERLEMIRALKLAYIREVIIDITDKDGQSLGTKVEIYISEPQPENKTHEP